MSNPYESPGPTSRTPQRQADVNAPAIALMVVSALAVVFGILGLAGDFFLLASGAVEQLEQANDGGISKYTTITVRIIWGILLVVVSGFVFYGALQMKQLTNYSTARMAAILAMIPCVGPCCFLGIPFGIWAFVVLERPEVKDAFR